MHDRYPTTFKYQVCLERGRRKRRTDQRLFGVISLINLKIYKEKTFYQVSTIKYFFGDARPTKSSKSEQKTVFLERRMEDRSKIIWGFILYLKINREKHVKSTLLGTGSNHLLHRKQNSVKSQDINACFAFSRCLNEIPISLKEVLC